MEEATDAVHLVLRILTVTDIRNTKRGIEVTAATDTEAVRPNKKKVEREMKKIAGVVQETVMRRKRRDTDIVLRILEDDDSWN